jgi:tellurite resistance protein TerC
MALICIEFMDLIFALDSVPAVFAISTEPFVVYSSNIFAILGLRTMYFAVVAMLDRFKYMSYALSIVLVFIGAKVFYNGFIGKIDPVVSMGITVGVLMGGAIFSILRTRRGGADE